MKKTLFKMVSIALFILLIFADVVSQDTDLDSLTIDMKIDLINNLQKKAFMTLRNESLTNRNFGIEINPFFKWDKSFMVSAGFSLFNIDRNAEIAFPVFYLKPEKSYNMTTFTLDCHYRRFIGNSQNGCYLSSFVRYAYLEGVRKRPYSYYSESNLKNRTHENKLGLGFGFGYRKFWHTGIYWGIGFSLGRYIVGESNKFRHESLLIDFSELANNDSNIIIDLEFLKLGWAF